MDNLNGIRDSKPYISRAALLVFSALLWVSASYAETLESLTVGSNGYILTEDLTVTGDVTVDGGVLDINGHTLTIDGNLTITNHNSRLKMVAEEDADRVIVKGNVIFSGAASDGYLTAGVLEVGGDFSQIGGSYQSNLNDDGTANYGSNTFSFSASGTHKTILNGTGAQTVRFDRPSISTLWSHFQDLEINNSAGVILSTDIAAVGEAKWVEGSMTGDGRKLYVHTASRVVEWPGDVGASAGWTLQSDQTVINGDLTTTGNAVDLNGHSLTINGDVSASGTLIHINKGTLEISGDFASTDSYGRLKMINIEDVVEVTGNVTFNGAASDGYLTAGILKVGGDFNQIGGSHQSNLNDDGTANYGSNTFSFSASGTHKTILNGTQAQTVRIDRPSISTLWSHFQDLEINNSAGVILSTDIAAVGEAKWVEGSMTGDGRKLYVHTASRVVEWPGDVGASAGWTLQSDQTVINGDLTTTGNTVDLNGHSLTINGDVSASGTLIHINKGTLEISGDFTSMDHYGRLKMVDVEDIVEVMGSVTFNGAASDGYLMAGILKVGGDFSQIGGSHQSNLNDDGTANYGSNTFSFSASGTHKTILNGTQAQTVRIDRPSISTLQSHFQDLEINNSSVLGITLTTDIAAQGEAKWTLGEIAGANKKLYVHDGAVLVNWHGDVGASAGWVLQSDQTVSSGNLTTTGNTVDLNGHALTVNGNVDANGTLIDINGGPLTISGDLSIAGNNGRLKMVNASDLVEVVGSVTFYGAASDGYLTAGVLKVGGDFSQRGGSYQSNGSQDYSADYGSNTFSFSASDTHKTVLNGTGLQTVHFDRPSPAYSHFQNVEVSNTSAEGINFSPSNQITYTGSYYVQGKDPVLGGDPEAWGEPLDMGGAGSYAAPGFADLDDDGDQDMYVGQQNGTIHLYENLMDNPRQGKTGLGKNFTGANYANIADVPDLRLGGVFTIEFWMKVDGFALAWQQGLIGKSLNGSNGRNYVIWINGEKRLHFSYHNAAGDDINMETQPDAFAIDQWHHVAVTLDNPGGVMKIFIDGVAQASGTASGVPVTNDSLVLMGRNADGARADYYDGILDEIRFSDIVRYGSDFTPSTEPFSSDANTLALWHSDEFDRLDMIDSSGNGHDGIWTPWRLETYTYADIDVGDHATPTFADIDADGDLDLFVGSYAGQVYLFENTGSRYAPVWSEGLQLKDEAFQLIFPGIHSSPRLVDIDADGSLDLFVGYYNQPENTGAISYYRNVGTPSSPVWRWVTNTYADLSYVGSLMNPCFADMERDADYDLILGTSDGTLSLYRNIGTSESPTWTILPVYPYRGVDVYDVSAPVSVDVDADGLQDLLIGNSSGYVYMMQNEGNQRIVIDDNRHVALDEAVTLTLNGEGMEVTGYYVSNEAIPPAADDPGWVDMDPTTTFSVSSVSHVLVAGDGLKTVYVWFKDDFGGIYNMAYDTIRLDKRDTTHDLLDAASPVDFNESITGQFQDATEIKYYSFLPGDWQKLMLRFDADTSGDDYRLGLYLYSQEIDDYFFSTSYLGSSFDELIVFEKVPDKIVIKVEWIGDPAPSGAYSLEVNTAATVTAGDELWEFATGGVIFASAAVSGSRVYIGSHDFKIYAIDVQSGEMLWEYQTGAAIFSSPAVSGGKVYVGSDDTKLYALDAVTGMKLWEFQTGHVIRSSPAVSGGKVYVSSYDGKVYCLDAQTGEKLWEYNTFVAIQASPAVSNGKVYFGADDGKVYSLDAQTGFKLWEYQTPGAIHSSPALSGGKVYVGSHDTKLYCLDAETGENLWEYQTGAVIYSSPGVSDGSVYVGSHDAKLYSLDAETGAKLWEFQIGTGIYASPTISSGRVYFGSYDAKLYCLDARTGTKLWEYQTGHYIESSATVQGGRLYVGSHDSKLYSIDAGDPNGDDWPMFNHDLQHTSDPDHYMTQRLYGYIEAVGISEFNEYDLRLIEVYSDNDFPAPLDLQFSVSDTGIATLSGNKIAASQNGRVVVGVDHDGNHYQRTMFLMISPDDWEGWDNDTKEKADNLPPDEFWQGDLISGTGDDVDYFQLTLAQDAIIDIGYLAEGSVADTRVALYDASDDPLISVVSENGVSKRMSIGLTAGTYYLKVTPAGDITQDSYYYITHAVVETMAADDPVAIGPDQTRSATVNSLADPTLFQLNLIETRSLDIIFTPTSLTADYRIDLLDQDEAVIAWLVSENGMSGRISVALQPGDYALRVAGIENVDASHPFTISLKPSQILYEIEPNDTYSQGTGLGEGISMKGFLSEGDLDFYAFTLDVPRYMKLDFVAETAGTEYNLILYKSDDQNPIDSTVCQKGASALIEVGLTAGDYYLKVEPVGVTDIQPAYTITLAQSANTQLEIESNNTILFANTFDSTRPKQGRIYADTDLDYYGFYVPEEVFVEVSFSSESSAADYTISITNGAETSVYQKLSADGAAVTLPRKLPAGNYFVRVEPGDDVDPNAFYHLSTATVSLTGLKTLAGISLDAAAEKVSVGGSLQINALGNYSDATQAPISGVAWSSSDEAFATVDQSGMVTGVSDGYVTIYASLGGQVELINLTTGFGEVQDYQTWGNLILVAGGGIADTNVLKDSTQYLSNVTYSRFVARGFEKKDIHYLNPKTGHDIDGDTYPDHIVSDDTPTVDDVRWAIEQWARDQASVGPLYIVLIDHGGIGTFEIMPGEIITGTELYASISAFENATNREVVVIIEACKSGSFVDDLFDPGTQRMIITSTDEGNAYLGLKGQISFTQFFMDSLLGGDTFEKSHQRAKARLASCGRPYSLMDSQIVEGGDATLSQERLGGNFAIAGLLPEILAQTQDFATQAQTTHEFNVTVSDLTGQTKVWAVVETPDYRAPSVVVDLEAPEVQLPTFDLVDEENSILDGVFKGSYGDFVYNGQYKIVFYGRNAEDMVTISPPTTVSVTGGLDITTDPGDVNGDGTVSLKDALVALQVVLGITPSSPVYSEADVNSDQKIGMAEVIYILQTIAGL